MKFLVVLSIFFAAGIAAPKQATIPSYVKTCKRDQPKFDDCLKNSIQALFPKLSRGIKEMDLPPLDPLYIEEALYEYGSGSVQGKTIMRDAYAYGLSTAKFTSMKTNFEDPNNMIIEADFHVDKARVEGSYKQQGKFLNAVINGKGKINITTEDVDINWKIIGALQTKNGGEKYLKVTSFVVTPKVGQMYINADNLFNGNEILSKAILTMVNENWRSTYDEMLPYTQEVWDKIFRQVANRVFSKFPFDQIFPETK